MARDDERRWLRALCTTTLGKNERCSLEIGQQVNLDSDPPEPYGPDGYRVGLLRDMSLTITVLPWLCPSGDACGSDVPVSTGEFEFRIDPADPF